MPKTYVLLQDTPSHEKGEEFYYKETAARYFSARTVKGFQLGFPPEFVENNRDWFKIKEEKVWTDSDMMGFCEYLDKEYYSLDQKERSEFRPESLLHYYKRDVLKIITP